MSNHYFIVCIPRWYRLRGNLLFYLRSSEQWSEPAGVIVLENHTVNIQEEDENGNWAFQIGNNIISKTYDIIIFPFVGITWFVRY